MTLKPLQSRFDRARIEQHPLRSGDGLELGLTRIVPERETKAAVLLTHGHTASADMFVLPETRNIVDVLLDSGYEPWLFDWRGSCRLPHNHSTAYTFDDVALYDVPQAITAVRERIGEDRKLFAVAHCLGALTLGMSLAAGLVRGLSGVVAQGVFLTPKMGLGPRLRFGLLGELIRPWIPEVPIDLRKVGLWSRYTPLFALASIGADCADPTCQMLHNSAWGTGASLFVHDNLHRDTHDRLANLLGPAPTCVVPHLRKMELARAVVSWNEADERYRPLPTNAVDEAHRIDCPLLLVSGRQNGLWLDSNRLCAEVLRKRHPQLEVGYVEVPGYGHFDAFVGRSAALDVFPHITGWLDQRAEATA